MIVYDFKIFYKLRKTNSANESSRRLNYKKASTLNIKLLSSLQNKLTLLKSMRDSSKIFNNAFEITNVWKLNSALNARNLKEIFENATMKSNVQKFKSSKSIKSFRKIFKNASLKSNVHVNIFIWQKSSEKSLMQNNRKTSLWTNFVFQLTNIQVVILKKKLRIYLRKHTTSQRNLWNVLLKNFKIKIRSCNNLN